MKIESKDKQLIDAARNIIKKRWSRFSSVGAALRTKGGRIYLGVNIEMPSSSCSMCAEHGAIAQAVTNGDIKFDTVVAVRIKNKKFEIISPCGKCREIIKEFENVNVILTDKNKIMKKPIKELLPFEYIGD